MVFMVSRVVLQVEYENEIRLSWPSKFNPYSKLYNNPTVKTDKITLKIFQLAVKEKRKRACLIILDQTPYIPAKLLNFVDHVDSLYLSEMPKAIEYGALGEKKVKVKNLYFCKFKETAAKLSDCSSQIKAQDATFMGWSGGSR